MAKKKSEYNKAYDELQGIIAQLSNDEIGIDELSTKIKRAQVLIKGCKSKLRDIEEDLEVLFQEDE